MSDAPRKKVIPLPGKIRVGGLVLAEVTMREPFIEDELDAAAEAALNGKGTQAETEVHLMAILTGIDFRQLIKAPRGFRMILAAALMDFTSTPWTELDGTPSSSPASPGGLAASAG